MDEEQIEKLVLRTKRFALEIIRLNASLTKSAEGQIIGQQIIRWGTLVGAYCRDAVRVKSTIELNRKLEKGRQALEKTCYWLELLQESGVYHNYILGALYGEAKELLIILATISSKTKLARRNLRELA